MKTFIYLCLMLGSIQAYASHLLGGYIQARPLTPGTLTYEIIVTLYHDEFYGSAASSDANSLSICFGDGTTGTIQRASRRSIANRIASVHVYQTQHTFAGPGTYTLTTALSSRSFSANLEEAEQSHMALTTTFIISSQFPNQTPTFLLPEGGFRLAVNRQAVINLSATDAEGDSLVYALARPLTSIISNRSDICNNSLAQPYRFPNDVAQQGVFKLDRNAGVLIWDAPVNLGRYIVTIVVEERRNGITLSRTLQEVVFVVEDRPGSGPPTTIPPYEPAVEGVEGLITGITDYTDTNVQVRTFPNPIDDRLQILIQSSRPTTATLQLHDANGRLIHQLSFNESARQHEQRIDLRNLAAGVYLMRTSVNGQSITQKVLKK